MPAGQTTDPREDSIGAGSTPRSSDYVVPTDGAGEEADAKEKAIVQDWFKKYDTARKFDINYRKQVAIDRRYAAGTSDTSWAVDTNLIGSYIDILVALLYARDPDVSVRKAPQTDNEGTDHFEDFARTGELIVSYLWKKARLRKTVRKTVRSTLSVATGWVKANMISEELPMPEVRSALNDKRETMMRLEGELALQKDPDANTDPDVVAAREEEIEDLKEEIGDLDGQLEVAVKRQMAIDFVPAEAIQVSHDVKAIEDYLDANWMGDEMYVLKDDVLGRFSELTAEDIVEAKVYYQAPPKEMTTRDVDNILPQGQLTAADAEGWTSNQSEANAVPFVRVIEIWDRIDKKIRTMIEGVKCWAKQPFAPNYPTSRFYPYFEVAFYEVDGQRWPQSLSWRMYKLQDEYACTRSNYRLTRERSIPGIIFNNTAIDKDEARKIQESKAAEFIGLRPTEPDMPIQNIFAPKPIASYDPRLFDTSVIVQDMERVSGVQEALQAAVSSSMPKTATEAQIQQSGINARTTSDRDQLEWMLTDLAQYTMEQALQCMTQRDAQRIAGKKAYWPGPTEDGKPGMDIEDLFTLCDIQIAAGSTGKPRAQMDQQAWGVILPLLQQLVDKIVMLKEAGHLPLATAYESLIKETMLRMGDDTDIDRFIPKITPNPTANAPKPTPPKVSVTLKGNLSPEAAQTLVAPTLAVDAAAAPNVPTPPQGAVPSTGTAPAPGPHLTVQPPTAPGA
jgi:hypothetical protein